ncbi:hypothetical protein A1QE_12580 [Vibrio breoganii ZF-55]|nr:hypothetical protein A1QE_12580 [Vibrio breoganii ZF-55]
MDRFIERFGAWFCVFALLLIGSFCGIFFDAGLSQSMSYWANISTVLAFLLALKAYRHWVRQETLGLQKQLVREILMEIVDLDQQVNDMFSDSIFDEGQLVEVIFPNNKQRKVFSQIPLTVKRIEVLIKKYYVLDLTPSPTLDNLSKKSAAFFTFEGDIFCEFKSLAGTLCRLEVLLSENNTLKYESQKLRSSLPLEQKLHNDQSTQFYNQTSFTGICIEMNKRLRNIERSLRSHIS